VAAYFNCSSVIPVTRNGNHIQYGFHCQLWPPQWYLFSLKGMRWRKNKVPEIKRIVPYKMKFLVPNYSCLQTPCLGGYRPQIPVLSVLNWICWIPPPPPENIPGYATAFIDDSISYLLRSFNPPVTAANQIKIHQTFICIYGSYISGDSVIKWLAKNGFEKKYKKALVG
jgi:hypothetical protein